MEAYAWYKKGYLPDEGTWMDQTDRFAKLIPVVEEAAADVERQLLNQQKAAVPKVRKLGQRT